MNDGAELLLLLLSLVLFPRVSVAQAGVRSRDIEKNEKIFWLKTPFTQDEHTHKKNRT
jgi:hypothetical protein